MIGPGATIGRRGRLAVHRRYEADIFLIKGKVLIKVDRRIIHKENPASLKAVLRRVMMQPRGQGEFL